MQQLIRFLLFVTVIGLICILLTRNLKPGSEVADFLPTDTLALMEWDHFGRSWERWQHSPLAKKIKDPDMPRVLEQLGLSDTRMTELKTASGMFDRLSKTAFFAEILNGTALLALLPEPQGRTLNPADSLPRLVLILPDGAGFSRPEQWEQLFGPVQSTDTAVFQGIPLVTLHFKSGRNLTFSRYRGQLVCALNPEPVQRCLDLALQRMVRAHSGLQSNPEYQRLRKHRSGQTDFFFYADVSGLSALHSAVGKTEHSEGIIAHHLALLHRSDAEHDGLTLIARVPPAQLRAFTDRYRLAPPVENPASRQITTETQLYLWTDWFAAKILWDLGMGMGDQETGSLMFRLTQDLIEGSGKTPDDFFDVFGTQFGVFITEHQVPSASNATLIGMYIEVRDSEEVDRMLQHLLAGLQTVTVLTQGIEIHSVIMAGGLLQPSYALVEKHLIFADSMDLIEQLLRRGGLAPELGTSGSGPDTGKTGNFFLFVRTRTVAEQLIAILTSLTRDTGEQGKILTIKSRLLIEHAVIPLLATLQGAATSRFRGSAAGDEVILEMEFTTD